VTERPAWVPEDIDMSRPSAARMYDYYLGGLHNFAADRELAEQALAAMPDGRLLAQANRAFLRRAVGYLARSGVDQFLDLGSGIPTRGNVHEIAQRVNPAARVAYVDIDPVAVAHARLILTDNPRAVAVQEDLRFPDRVLGHPEVAGLLDLDRPLAVLLFAVLHFVPDSDDPAGLLAALTAPLVPGSHVAISHGTDEGRATEDLSRVYRRTATPLTMRGRAEVAALFGDLALVEPGVVWAPLWHPAGEDEPLDHPERAGSYVGVARKR
jgi:SAM-dependent methyltransferase